MIHKTRDDNGVLTHYMNECAEKDIVGLLRSGKHLETPLGGVRITWLELEDGSGKSWNFRGYIGSKQVRGYYREAEAKLSSRFGLETIGHGHGHFKFLRTTFVCDECGNKLRSTQTVDEGKEVKCGECEKYSLTLV